MRTSPHYTNNHWADWKDCVFLGTERNPHTGLVYDYWLVNTATDLSVPKYSWTCKHGNEPHEYGSGPIECIGASDISVGSTISMSQDYIFGIVRAKFLGLLYLATGNKPLVK